MMSLLFIIIPGYDKSGPSRHLIHDKIAYFIQHGIKVSVLSFKAKGVNRSLYTPLDENIKNYRCLLLNRLFFIKKNFVLRYLYELWLVMRLAPYLFKNRHADYVHIYSLNSSWLLVLLIRYLTKAKIILNVQDVFPENGLYSNVFDEKSLLYHIFQKLQRLVYDAAHVVVAISQDIKTTLIKLGVDDLKIKIIHNWMEEFYIDETTIRETFKKLDLNFDKKYMIYAGNVGTMQNVKSLIDLFVKYASAEYCLLIVGEGNDRENLKQQFENFENVCFINHQSAEVASILYTVADINTITLKDKIIYTALPSKTPACLQSGKPLLVLCNENSNYASIIKEYTRGHILDVDLYDSNEIFLEALRDTNENNGGEVIKKYFSKSVNLKKYLRLFKEEK